MLFIFFLLPAIFGVVRRTLRAQRRQRAYNANSMNTPSDSPKRSITDSPWYWVYLFCTAGAVALLLAGPKFAARQAQIERKYEARQKVAQQVAKQQLNIAEQEAEQLTATRITLWPLYLLLGVVLSVAWFNLWRRHKRQSEPESTVPPCEANA